MTPTAKALRQLARQLDRAYRHASLGGNDVSVRVKDPRILINIMRRAARELER
jgi:hypothetical protein